MKEKRQRRERGSVCVGVCGCAREKVWMGMLHRGLTPRCKGPPQIILHLSLSVLTPPTLRPVFPSYSHTHTHTYTRALPLSLTHPALHTPSLFSLCHSLFLPYLSAAHSPPALQCRWPLNSIAPPHTFTQTHTTWLLQKWGRGGGGGNRRKSRLMCGTNEGGDERRKGRKKEGQLFTTIGTKQGEKGLGEANATTRCVYSLAGVWLKGSYSESAVLRVLSSS